VQEEMQLAELSHVPLMRRNPVVVTDTRTLVPIEKYRERKKNNYIIKRMIKEKTLVEGFL
jgi:hypothetical protein